MDRGEVIEKERSGGGRGRRGREKGCQKEKKCEKRESCKTVDSSTVS